jgi:predicted HD phosphohydrolase
MGTEAARTVDFVRMKDGTREEFLLLRELEADHAHGLVARVLRELSLQAGESLPGYRVTRLEHALQSATRARREGADTDWIVAALLHDVGDGLAPYNHDRFAAEILRPYLREQVTWTVEHHGVFQTWYYGHHYGWDRNARDAHRDSPYFDSCAAFCERWDQESFDPDYASDPLSSFEPLVQAVFARTPWAPEHLQPGVIVGP